MPIDGCTTPTRPTWARSCAPASPRWAGSRWPCREDVGGSGLSAVEHALFFREVGRQCGPVDVLAQSLAANVAQDAALREAITSGEVGVALAVADGDRLRILGAPDAAHRAAGRAGRRAAYCWPAQAEAAVLAGPGDLDARRGRRRGQCRCARRRHIWQLGQLGVAAMLVGLAEAALDQIVEYAKVRETFGRKIGAWQAVRHPCADMAIRVEAARSQLWFAATAIKEGRADAARPPRRGQACRQPGGGGQRRFQHPAARRDRRDRRAPRAPLSQARAGAGQAVRLATRAARAACSTRRWTTDGPAIFRQPTANSAPRPGPGCGTMSRPSRAPPTATLRRSSIATGSASSTSMAGPASPGRRNMAGWA